MKKITQKMKSAKALLAILLCGVILASCADEKPASISDSSGVGRDVSGTADTSVDDPNPDETDALTPPPTVENPYEKGSTSWDIVNGKYTYYVNRFLMPWVPGDPALSTPVPEATAEPTPAPTPEPTATPAPTAEPTPGVTEEPIIADVVVLTPPPAATDAPEMTAAPEVAAEPAEAPTAEPTADPTAEPTPEPTEVPVEAPTYPCQGKDGTCTFITRNEDDPFCRFCDWNDNGVEDSKE